MYLQSKSKAPVIEPEVRTKRTQIPWQTSSYDDEATLLHLRLKYPQASWSRISGIFNASIPSSRERTADSITSKGKRLMKAHQQTPTSSKVLETSPTPSEARPHEYFHQPTILPYTPWEPPVAHMEALHSSWDMVDGQGYSNLIVEEMENLEDMRQRALEAAAGIRRQ